MESFKKGNKITEILIGILEDGQKKEMEYIENESERPEMNLKRRETNE